MISAAALGAVMALNAHNDPRYWAIRWQFGRGTGFYDLLLRAAAHADDSNLARIGAGFGALADGVRRWKTVPFWAEQTRRWAESLVSHEEAQ